MRGTDKVHIGTFEEDHIEAVQFGSRRAAECRVDIMAAGPAQLHRHAVHQHAVFLYLHVTETDTAVETADLLSVLAEGDGQRIEVRMFGIPFQRIADGEFITVSVFFPSEEVKVILPVRLLPVVLDIILNFFILFDIERVGISVIQSLEIDTP